MQYLLSTSHQISFITNISVVKKKRHFHLCHTTLSALSIWCTVNTLYLEKHVAENEHFGLANITKEESLSIKISVTDVCEIRLGDIHPLSMTIVQLQKLA